MEAVDLDFQLLSFLVDSVAKGDWIVHSIETLIGEKKDLEKLDSTQLALRSPGNRIVFLRENSQILMEMFLSRLVDNFQKYLADLIRAVLRSRPVMLSTSQHSISLEELLKYSTIEDLVRDVIERKVNSLSYDGFAELYDWCSGRGIPLQLSESDRFAVVELIATRNVIAHNRGLVDERYVRTVGSSRFPIGKTRTVEISEVLDGLALLHRVVFETDTATIQKFGLDSEEILPNAAK